MRFTLALASLALTAFLSGCATGEVKMSLPLADGGQITFPLRTGPVPAEVEGYRVKEALLLPSKEPRKGFYVFDIIANHPSAISRIQVDDVSDEKVMPALDDEHPKFVNNQWHGESPVIDADDARLQWLFQIPPSLRVYRFTLTTNDGRTLKMYHVAAYPAPVKAVLRHDWGEKY
jgi:hypothetical protein